MEAVVLHRVGFLAYFCPKQGQDFKPSAAPLYPNMGQVPPPPPPPGKQLLRRQRATHHTIMNLSSRDHFLDQVNKPTVRETARKFHRTSEI